jgi:DNA (cytosine-5)-methyltransferase 1
MEFGATYPYEKTTPSRMRFEDLIQYRGIHGQPLSEALDLKHLFTLLPSHARRDQDIFPPWKIEYIRKNRAFYECHMSWLDKWIPKIHEFPSSLQKLEWNCQGEKNRNIRSYILQIRPSGVRVKRKTTIPSIVAMTSTQVPIVAWQSRYVTLKECKRLQSMDGLKSLPESRSKAYKALGNAINVKVALLVAKALVGQSTPDRKGAQNIRQLEVSAISSSTYRSTLE